MSKKKKLYKLRSTISIEIERIKVLLEHLIYKADNPIEINVLADIALEKSHKISRLSENLGRILKHWVLLQKFFLAVNFFLEKPYLIVSRN